MRSHGCCTKCGETWSEDNVAYFDRLTTQRDPAKAVQHCLKEAQSTVRKLGSRRHVMEQSLAKARDKVTELEEKMRGLDRELEQAAETLREATTAYGTRVIKSELLEPPTPHINSITAGDAELLGDVPKLRALLEEGGTLSEEHRARFATLLDDADFRTNWSKRRKQCQPDGALREGTDVDWETAGGEDAPHDL